MHNTKLHLNTQTASHDEWTDEWFAPTVTWLHTHLRAVGASIAPLSQPSGRRVQRRRYSRSLENRCSRSLPCICIRKQTAHDKGTKDKKWIKKCRQGSRQRRQSQDARNKTMIWANQGGNSQGVVNMQLPFCFFTHTAMKTCGGVEK